MSILNSKFLNHYSLFKMPLDYDPKPTGCPDLKLMTNFYALFFTSTGVIRKSTFSVFLITVKC